MPGRGFFPGLFTAQIRRCPDRAGQCHFKGVETGLQKAKTAKRIRSKNGVSDFNTLFPLTLKIPWTLYLKD
jgi:hypothetical protein